MSYANHGIFLGECKSKRLNNKAIDLNIIFLMMATLKKEVHISFMKISKKKLCKLCHIFSQMQKKV